MNDEAMIEALHALSGDLPEGLIRDTKQFLTVIDTASRAGAEEAVPAEMMQMFSDAQWAELLFEFQPAATLFVSDFDIATMHQHWMEHGEVQIPDVGEPQRWLIYADQEGLIVRSVDAHEFQALDLAASGASFSAMAAELWPDLTVDQSHHKMTELLLVWLNDSLIIDAGVPLPEDAEFEENN